MKRYNAIRIVFLLIMVMIVTGVTIGCTKNNLKDPSQAKPVIANNDVSLTPPSEGWWLPDMDCYVCHSKNEHSQKDSSVLASAHAQAGQKCLDCHKREKLQEVHEVTAQIPSSITLLMPKEMCLECHGPMEELIASTADSEAFMTMDGKSVNPHIRPNEKHDDNLECYTCHRNHIVYDNKGYCFSCHHTGDLTCYTCH